METAGKPWIEDRKEVPYLALPVVTPMGSLARGLPAVGDKLLSLIGTTGWLPAGSYACWLNQGDPGGVAAATGRLVDWAQFQGLVFDRPASDPDGWTCRLEEYLVDPADVQDPGDWRTRIALKLADEPPFQYLTDNSATASEPT